MLLFVSLRLLILLSGFRFHPLHKIFFDIKEAHVVSSTNFC